VYGKASVIAFLAIVAIAVAEGKDVGQYGHCVCVLISSHQLPTMDGVQLLLPIPKSWVLSSSAPDLPFVKPNPFEVHISSHKRQGQADALAQTFAMLNSKFANTVPLSYQA
jgi:hypothetical protein